MCEYLLRFDDFCPTMNHGKWVKLAGLLDQYSIKPIVAIVPDNQDPSLKVATADTSFWNRMNELQASGYIIALHGYQHVCQVHGNSIVPLHSLTEFAGASEAEQRCKLESGIRILESHGLTAKVWVAPRHGFDHTTVKVLRQLGIQTISDGFARYPFRHDGVLWIPQQLWDITEMGAGVWTVCYHPNTLTDRSFEQLRNFLQAHHREFTTVEDVQQRWTRRRRTLGDRIFDSFWRSRMVLRDRLSRVRHQNPARAAGA
jgi:predicted deacetylase